MPGQTPPTGAPRPLKMAALSRHQPFTFLLEPDAGARAALAETLGISQVRKLRFSGELIPEGRGDWLLRADLGATVVQPCVVTLAPVTTRIDQTVTRRYLARWQEPEVGSETEMPEDDTVEPLPELLDLAGVMAEALALALPDYPRVAGANLGEAVYTEPGVEPLTEEKIHPFAGLAGLAGLKGKGTE